MTATAYPEILYSDCDAGIEWLTRTLGFIAGEVHRDGDGAIAHAELSLDGAAVMLASDCQFRNRRISAAPFQPG